MHKCTEKEINQFYKPSKNTMKAFNYIKTELMCMNDIDIQGKLVDKKIFGDYGA
jgi:hypothetical protein